MSELANTNKENQMDGVAQHDEVAVQAPSEELGQFKVLYDRGTHLVVLPKKLPLGQTVAVGEPRNIEAQVVAYEDDGLSVCEVLPEFLPRRAAWAHDWLPERFLGEHGPLVGEAAQ